MSLFFISKVQVIVTKYFKVSGNNINIGFYLHTKIEIATEYYIMI